MNTINCQAAQAAFKVRAPSLNRKRSCYLGTIRSARIITGFERKCPIQSLLTKMHRRLIF